MAACLPLQIDVLVRCRLFGVGLQSAYWCAIGLLPHWHSQLPEKWQSDCTLQDMEAAGDASQRAASVVTIKLPKAAPASAPATPVTPVAPRVHRTTPLVIPAGGSDMEGA